MRAGCALPANDLAPARAQSVGATPQLGSLAAVAVVGEIRVGEDHVEVGQVGGAVTVAHPRRRRRRRAAVAAASTARGGRSADSMAWAADARSRLRIASAATGARTTAHARERSGPHSSRARSRRGYPRRECSAAPTHADGVRLGVVVVRVAARRVGGRRPVGRAGGRRSTRRRLRCGGRRGAARARRGRGRRRGDRFRGRATTPTDKRARATDGGRLRAPPRKTGGAGGAGRRGRRDDRRRHRRRGATKSSCWRTARRVFGDQRK